jgi:hypothetical protein
MDHVFMFRIGESIRKKNKILTQAVSQQAQPNFNKKGGKSKSL